MTANEPVKQTNPFEQLPDAGGAALQTIGTGGTMLNFADLAQSWRFCEILSKSALVPKAYQGQPASILVAFEWGANLGIYGLQALQCIAIINGKPGIYGDLGRAIVLRQDDLAEFAMWHEGTFAGGDLCGRCKIVRRRPGLFGNVPAVSFVADESYTAAMSKQAGTWGKNTHSSYPEPMAEWRAFWRAARKVYADALLGFHGAEELDAERIKPAVVVEVEAPGPRQSRSEQLKSELAGAPAVGDTYVAGDAENPGGEIDPTPSSKRRAPLNIKPEPAPEAQPDAEAGSDERAAIDLAMSNVLEGLVGQRPPGSSATQLEDSRDVRSWLAREIVWGFGKQWGDLNDAEARIVYDLVSKGKRLANHKLPNKKDFAREVRRFITQTEIGGSGAAELAAEADIAYDGGDPDALSKGDLEKLLDALRMHADLQGGD